MENGINQKWVHYVNMSNVYPNYPWPASTLIIVARVNLALGEASAAVGGSGGRRPCFFNTILVLFNIIIVYCKDI